MPLGTASDLMVGETCIAIGNAYGYEHTVTVGVVSAIGRDVTLNKEVSYKSLIQTDASINPGNSGGPLINIHGDLIGVNVAIRAGAQGIGFAIPVETMIRTACQMLPGRNRPGGSTAALGLSVRDVVRKSTEDSTPLRSVVVERVDPQGPASRAGLLRGDLLVRLGEVPVACSLDVERALLDVQPGDPLGLLVRRQGVERQIDLAMESIRSPAPPQGAELVWRRLGLRLHPIAPEDVVHNHPQLHGGLLVGEIRGESPAAKAGLQRGDILVGLDKWEMLNLDNVLFVLNQADAATASPLRFYILRANQVHRGWFQNVE
jgi:serine protease Do